MADAELVLGLNATEFNNGIESARRSLGSFAKGALSIAAVGTAFRAVITATMESAKAVSALDSALASSGRNVGFTSKQLQDYATQLQNTSAYGDEAILGLQTTLLNFQKVSGPVFTEATKLSMDLAARMGTDLTSAAKTVGRALEDPVKGINTLRRANITLTQDQQALIKSFAATGDIVSAQGVILQELENRVGGAAEAYANTLPGAIQQTQESLGNLLESPNGTQATIDSFKQLNKVLQDPKTQEAAAILTQLIIDGFTKVIQFVSKAINGVQRFGEVVAQMITGTAIDDVEAFNTQLGQVEGQIAAIQNRLARGDTLNPVEQRALDALVEEKRLLQDKIKLAKEYAGTPGPMAAPTVTPPTAGPGYTPPTAPPTPPKTPKIPKIPAIDAALLESFNKVKEGMMNTFGSIPDYLTAATTGPEMKSAVDRADAALTAFGETMIASMKRAFANQQPKKTLATQIAEMSAVVDRANKDVLRVGLDPNLGDAGAYERLKKYRDDVTTQLDTLKQELGDRTAEFQYLYEGLLPDNEQAELEFNRQKEILDTALADQIISLEQYVEAGKLLMERFSMVVSGNYAEDFQAGWTEAFNNFKTQVEDTADFAETMFTTLTDGLSSALVTFAETGKLSFKGLIRDMMHEIIKMLANKIVMNFLGMMGLGGPTGKGGGGFFSDLFAGMFADGGMIPSGKFGIVGERGPELISGPASVLGTDQTQSLMANRSPQTTVNYNINAVDARSFRDMVARDPEFIYAVSRAGARRVPG